MGRQYREYFDCYRCGGMIPNNRTPGAYPGATSLVAPIEICTACGYDEAILTAHGQALAGPWEWPVEMTYPLPGRSEDAPPSRHLATIRRGTDGHEIEIRLAPRSTIANGEDHEMAIIDEFRIALVVAYEHFNELIEQAWDDGMDLPDGTRHTLDAVAALGTDILASAR